MAILGWITAGVRHEITGSRRIIAGAYKSILLTTSESYLFGGDRGETARRGPGVTRENTLGREEGEKEDGKYRYPYYVEI